MASQPATAEAAKNPTIDLVEKLTGTNVTSQKLRCDWQLWSKDHFSAHKATFETEFRDSGLNAKEDKAHCRVAFIQRKFAELPEPERAEWAALAAAEKAAKPAKKGKRDKRKSMLLDPASAQA